MVRRESARSVRRGCFPQVKFRAKTAGWRPPLLELQAQAPLRVLLPANSRVMRRVLLPANSPVKTAEWRPPLLGPQATEILRAQVRARQCLRGPAPFAFFREIPDAQKCNRAARYDECPIS